MATIKGKWKFNESPTIETTLSQEVNFTSDGKTYYKIICKPHNDIDNIPCIRYYRENLINYDDAFDWGTWTDGKQKQMVDFGDTEQEVSDEFYTWLTANATQVQEETKPTEYTLRIDGTEVTDYENVIVNGVSYKCKKKEETYTFSISTVNAIYYFPLDITSGVPFVHLNGLYDTTNSLYIYSTNADSYVSLMPTNYPVVDSIGYRVYGDTLVSPGDVFSTVSTGGSN